jgi:glutamate racemase
MKIGFFDSGLGGLCIQEEVRKLLPYYDYEYYGDTANLPYGDKSEEEINALTEAGITHLFERGVKLAIIACNTASAESARVLQERMLTGKYADRKILGVIIPTIETIIESNRQNVLLIGTRRTVSSKKYERELEKKHTSKITFTGVATPELVPLIEAHKKSDALDSLMNSIYPWVGEIDSLVLGCTHYPLLKEEIRERLGSGIDVISQDEIIPTKLAHYLHMHPEIESELTRDRTLSVGFSKLTETYERLSIELIEGYRE